MSRRRFQGYARASKPRRVPGQMNGAEREYAAQLDVRRAAGEVTAWWYEHLTLKLAHDTRYTPDFFVLLSSGELEVVEIKGGLIRDDARVKLKVAAGLYPFCFVMMQKLPKKLGGGWKREEIPSDTWQSEAAA